MPGSSPGFCMGGENLNEHLLKRNEEIYRKLNIPAWHAAGITGAGVNVAVIGYGGCLASKKPYLTNVNDCGTGSYHDGDEIIHAVAPGAKIFGINIFKGGWSFDEALRWCLEHDIDVICTSIRLSTWDYEREELSRQLYEKGCIMIDSADNEGKEDSIGYPAKSPYWFAVGAYDELNKGKAGYSSWGKELDCLMYTDLAVEAKEGYYVPISHTSGATQLVAGMVALLKEHLRITPEGFREFIRQHSIDIEQEGWDPKTGFGLFVLPAEIPKKEGEQEMNKPQYIIIHHSATKLGDAETFRRYHVQVNGWKDIGYHYVINNGTYKPDGFIEKGRDEKEVGAHAVGYNDKSIGICLVGNFDEDKPTQKQMQALTQLCKDIMQRYNIPAKNVLGHRETGAKKTCPGKNFCMDSLRKMLEVGEVPKCKTDYAGHWAEAAIEKVKAAGLMSGYPDGKFRPDQPVTRAELAAVLVRLIDKLEVKK